MSTALLLIRSREIVVGSNETTAIHDERSFASTLEACRESVHKTRQVLHHMQSEVFSGNKEVEAETDLILDPNPSTAWAERVLKGHASHGCKPRTGICKSWPRRTFACSPLNDVAIFWLRSPLDCSRKIHSTPNPDLTLENLVETTSISRWQGSALGTFQCTRAKHGSVHSHLWCQSLSGVHTHQKSRMIDELLDSLMLNRLPTEHQLETMLYELCRGAVDIEPILASFKMRCISIVGVRDILGKENVTATHRALADIADVCVRQVIENSYGTLVTKLGVPQGSHGSPCPFCFITVGKYGSREPNYHSDMSLLCLYESDGVTAPLGFGRHQPLDNCDFFHQLTYRVTQAINRMGRFGRLYEAKPWLVTENARSTAAWRIDEFENLFQLGQITAPKRLEFCSARVFYGDPDFKSRANQTKLTTLTCRKWTPSDSESVLQYRKDLEHGVAETNIKRGRGGTIEVELLTKLLLLQNCQEKMNQFATGTVDRLNNLHELGQSRSWK